MGLRRSRTVRILATTLMAAILAAVITACEDLAAETPEPGSQSVSPAGSPTRPTADLAQLGSGQPGSGGRPGGRVTVGPTTTLNLGLTPTAAVGGDGRPGGGGGVRPGATVLIRPTIPPALLFTPTPTPFTSQPAGGGSTSGGSSSGGSGSSGSGGGGAIWTSDRAQDSPFDRFLGGRVVWAGTVDLGAVMPPDQAMDSICDNTPSGGPLGSLSIVNPLSQYGGPFGQYSPFNPDATLPPAILVGGVEVGQLTVSPFAQEAVDPDSLFEWLGCPLN